MKYRLSRRADADIASISDYTLREWGIAQAAAYVGGMERFFAEIAATGVSGYETEGVQLSLRRLKYEHHFVFFERRAGELLIVRVLHERMDFVQHLIWD